MSSKNKNLTEQQNRQTGETQIHVIHVRRLEQISSIQKKTKSIYQRDIDETETEFDQTGRRKKSIDQTETEVQISERKLEDIEQAERKRTWSMRWRSLAFRCRRRKEIDKFRGVGCLMYQIRYIGVY